MYFVIPGESISDPLILNDMQVIGLDVIKAPDTSNFPYWYEFVVEGPVALIKTIQGALKVDWYAAMFDNTQITIIFTDQTFNVIEDNILTNAAVPAKEYGQAHGIQKEFLDWEERQSIYLSKLKQAGKI